MRETNWAGNYRYRAGKLHRPSTVERLQEVVAKAPRLRVLGSRHSFTDIADSDELVTLEDLPTEVVVDHDAAMVTCSAGISYGALAEQLQREGMALANLASLPHISVAGAVATATHGSGDANGNLATAVTGLELVTSSGEVLSVSSDDRDFDGLVVGLGALGAVTRVTLEVEPAYLVRQRLFEGLSWDALYEHFDEVTAAGYSVSVFTSWSEAVGQVWVKRRVTDDPEQADDQLVGTAAAAIDLLPAGRTPPDVPGPWWDRLPHFRMGFVPSSGAELQSEYLVPRRHAVAAIGTVHAMAELVRPVLQVSELRTVAADRLWMSPQYEQDTVAIHFTWHPDPVGVQRVLVELEAALEPFRARPHWGKVFDADATTIAPLYDRLPDFRRLIDRLDPRGAFRNPWLTDRVLGPD